MSLKEQYELYHGEHKALKDLQYEWFNIPRELLDEKKVIKQHMEDLHFIGTYLNNTQRFIDDAKLLEQGKLPKPVFKKKWGDSFASMKNTLSEMQKRLHFAAKEEKKKESKLDGDLEKIYRDLDVGLKHVTN